MAASVISYSSEYNQQKALIYCVTYWNKAQRDNQHRYQSWSADLESSISSAYFL